MGAASSVMKVRASTANTVAELISGFNNVTDTLLACGLLAVDLAQVPGQAGRFVAEVGGPGETPVAGLAAVGGATVVGYRVFKHPLEALWLRVDYIDRALSNTGSNRVTDFSFRLGEAVTADGSLANPVNPAPHELYGAGTSGLALSYLGNAELTLHACCGPGFFWAALQSPLVMIDASNAVTYASPVSPLALAWFKSGSQEVLVGPAPITPTSNSILGPAFTSASSPPLWPAVAYSSKVGPGNPWVREAGGACGHLLDPSKPFTSEGVRVSRARLIIDGQVKRFNFGFIGGAVLSEFGLITCDIGEGLKQYRAVKGFGPASPTYRLTAESHTSTLLLPWWP